MSIQNTEQKENNTQVEIKEVEAYVPADYSIADIFNKNQDDKPAFSRPSLEIVKPLSKPQVSNISTPIQAKLIEDTEHKIEDVIIGQYKKTYILIVLYIFHSSP